MSLSLNHLSKFVIQKEVEPTPRPDRIQRDYAQEYPSVEVESRKVMKQFPEKKKNIENVKLNEEV